MPQDSGGCRLDFTSKTVTYKNCFARAMCDTPRYLFIV